MNQLGKPERVIQNGLTALFRDEDAGTAGLAALDQRPEKTRAFKQAMMQDLLTGGIRQI